MPGDLCFAQRAVTTTEIRVLISEPGGPVAVSRSIMDEGVTLRAVIRVPGSREDNIVGLVTFRAGSRLIARRAVRGRLSPVRPGIQIVEAGVSGAELPVGTHRLKAIFRGSDRFRGSESRPRRHRVTKAPTRILAVETDAMDFEGELSEASFRSPVRITANVDSIPRSGIGPPRDGSVQYFSGRRLLGTARVGEPLEIDSLAAEQHQLTAEYLGSRNYRPSSSRSHPLLVSFARSLTVRPDVAGSSIEDRQITPGTSSGVIFRRPSSALTVNRFGSPNVVAVAYERQAIANGPVDIEMQLWDFSQILEERKQTITVSEAGVGVGFPDVAALLDGIRTDGSIVVVWQAPGVQGLDIFARIYSRVANSFFVLPEGPAFRVNTATGGDQRLPRVSATFNGGFVVVWQSPVIDSSGTAIFQRRFDPDGVPLGEESVVHPNLSGNQTLPEVAMLGTADYVVMWNDEGARRVRGRQFLSNGIPRTDEFTLDATLINANDRGARIAALPNSGYAIAWSRPDANSVIKKASFFRRFVGAVSPIGGLESLSFASTADESEPDIAPLTGGAFAAVWTGDDGAGSKGIGLRVYRSNGVATGLGEFANTQRARNQSGATISPIFSGQRFVVIWTSDRPGAAGSDLFLRLFKLPDRGL